ncbi:15480_t:CDS:2 [Funneliformis caledonium]|uniref:15480_t:CDS:1 n=1 Tax=Funneliformis caledonium TaxID=1117310 RepID=A0A9N9GWY3_9GLOM|nr:15480_t:CDS:2 [Funneliformis caledonium]
MDDNDAVVSSRKKAGTPKAFKDMTTIFEVYSSITAMDPQTAVASNNIYANKELARLWHEKIKCFSFNVEIHQTKL